MAIIETHLSRMFSRPNSTLGQWEVPGNDKTIWILEPRLKALPEASLVAMPPARYQVVWTESERFGHATLELLVHGHTGIRVHTGLTWEQTKGCLLPGLDHTENDGEFEIPSLLSSARARDLLNGLLEPLIRQGDHVFVTITNPPEAA